MCTSYLKTFVLALYSRVVKICTICLTISKSELCVYGFRIIISVNTNYVLEQH